MHSIDHVSIKELEYVSQDWTRFDYAVLSMSLVGTGMLNFRFWFLCNQTLILGIHTFMAIYGLSVFLDTPQQERKGRAFYIAVSFLITALSALCTILDAARTFSCLLEANSSIEYLRLRQLQSAMITGQSLTVLSNCSLRFLVFIGDALMVSRRIYQ